MLEAAKLDVVEEPNVRLGALKVDSRYGAARLVAQVVMRKVHLRTSQWHPCSISTPSSGASTIITYDPQRLALQFRALRAHKETLPGYRPSASGLRPLDTVVAVFGVQSAPSPLPP